MLYFFYERSIRLDVHPNGEIVYDTKAPVNWISLADISFTLESHKSHRPLDLVNGWVNYGNGCNDAKISTVGSIGEKTNRRQGKIAVLPPGYKPLKQIAKSSPVPVAHSQWTRHA